MKKKILITIAVLALFVLVFASCGGGGPSCEHEWELTTTTANCTQAGEGTYVCSLCQASETKDVAALGHDFPDEPNETKIATCIEGGYSLYICQREGCGHEEQKHPTDPDASNHSYKTQQASPTCTEPGFTVSQCEWCEQFDNDRVPLPALGHTFTRENPTGITIHEGECEKEGYISYKCQECDLAEIVKTYGDLTGADATEEDKALAEAAKLAPLEHSFTFIADPTTDLVLPTCTEPGHTVYTCANGCGAKQSTAGTADEVSPLGHTYNRVGSTVVYVVKEESTCCKEGFKIAQCQDCQHEATVEEYTANEDLKQVILQLLTSPVRAVTIILSLHTMRLIVKMIAIGMLSARLILTVHMVQVTMVRQWQHVRDLTLWKRLTTSGRFIQLCLQTVTQPA